MEVVLVESVLRHGQEGIERDAEPWREGAGERRCLLTEFRAIPVL